jgi:hypothetical protein
LCAGDRLYRTTDDDLVDDHPAPITWLPTFCFLRFAAERDQFANLRTVAAPGLAIDGGLPAPIDADNGYTATILPATSLPRAWCATQTLPAHRLPLQTTAQGQLRGFQRRGVFTPAERDFRVGTFNALGLPANQIVTVGRGTASLDPHHVASGATVGHRLSPAGGACAPTAVLGV